MYVLKTRRKCNKESKQNIMNQRVMLFIHVKLYYTNELGYIQCVAWVPEEGGQIILRVSEQGATLSPDSEYSEFGETDAF